MATSRRPKTPTEAPSTAASGAAAAAGKGERPRRYWLFKSEPDSYSFERFERERRTFWSGVRNYQARNLLRSEIQVGDGVLFYHSNHDPMAIVGLAAVVRNGYPDPTAFQRDSEYFDPDSDPEAPTWYVVDIECKGAMREPVTRERCKREPALAGMVLLQRGSRLSVQPVTADEWRTILRLGGQRESW
ncbi:MAG: EVE domain-containing protein [Planctomycetes bacterium]|nr:EVE domain-containing protein [Planctomycetota bacterium]